LNLLNKTRASAAHHCREHDIGAAAPAEESGREIAVSHAAPRIPIFPHAINTLYEKNVAAAGIAKSMAIAVGTQLGQS
jgi:hypothetical protein